MTQALLEAPAGDVIEQVTVPRMNECPFSPNGKHQKSSVPGKNTCQFCGASM